jgi:hypothetical protein
MSGSDPHCRTADRPDNLAEDPPSLNRIIAAMAGCARRPSRDCQAELSVSRYRRAEFGCFSEKLAREAEQLELVLETVEADQAERLARASPTVAAAGVEGLVGCAASLSYTLSSDRSVVAPGRRSSPRL